MHIATFNLFKNIVTLYLHNTFRHANKISEHRGIVVYVCLNSVYHRRSCKTGNPMPQGDSTPGIVMS